MLQFRLRTLLALSTAMCLGLCGWQLYWQFFRSSVEADSVRVNEAITVRVRLQNWGKLAIPLGSIHATRDAPGQSRVYVTSRGWALEKSGWWTYDAEATLPPLQYPGEYRLEFRPVQGPIVRGKLMVHDSVRDRVSREASKGRLAEIQSQTK